MAKEETIADIIWRIVDKELPSVITKVMIDKKLSLERKSTLIAQLDGAMQMLRLIRAGLEVP